MTKSAGGASYVYRGDGYCPICQCDTTFSAMHSWFRDHLICEKCRSIPRERALFVVLEMFYPNWRDLDIHESSPGNRGVSPKLARESKRYVATQFDPSLPLGSVDKRRNFKNENLEYQTFADAEFDLVITQDVFEHIFHPDLAIREIARTIRPGGAHICSVPIIMKSDRSRRRASIQDGKVVHLLDPQYHGNPIDATGSLVTIDWGYDICQYLSANSGLKVSLFHINDLSRGIQAEYIDILCCMKSSGVTL